MTKIANDIHELERFERKKRLARIRKYDKKFERDNVENVYKRSNLNYTLDYFNKKQEDKK